MEEMIKLDGRLDEAIWSTVPEYTDFRVRATYGGGLAEKQTAFKLVTTADCLYIGVKCFDPHVEYLQDTPTIYTTDHIEVVFSPANTPVAFYQFMVTYKGDTTCYYYEESGSIKPDPYAPDWTCATYIGEDYWTAEIAIPLSSLYMTRNTAWNDKWLLNIGRLAHKGDTIRVVAEEISSWNGCGFFETQFFNTVENMPIRPVEDDIFIVSAAAEIAENTADGYRGQLLVKTTNAVAGEFDFVSEHTDPVRVSLQAGENAFTVPCTFDRTGIRYHMSLALNRVSDGKEFKRVYPVYVAYEPIKLRFTLPEYRNNFYPGQDYTKIVGTVTAAKPVTLTLEGPGIPKQTLTPNADGSFCFETPNFEEGDAYLVATTEGYEITKKISRLAPTGHMMSWISGGNLIVDGKPVIRRNFYAYPWRGGEVLKRRYAAEPQYITPQVIKNKGYIQPDVLIKGIDAPGGLSTKDDPLNDELKAKIDEVMEAHKDYDFTYWYIFDEPECRQVSPLFMQSVYEYIANKDPYHVISIATRTAGQYLNCADWFEVHPYLGIYRYPDGSRRADRPINRVGRYLSEITDLNRPDKCIGMLPTCFSCKDLTLTADYPTLDEMICHCWAGMVRGGKSLWPFAYMDMLDRGSTYYGMRYVFSTFEALEEFMLFGKRTTLINTDEVEAVYYDLPDKKMFVLINKVDAPQYNVKLDAISGTWCDFRHARDITTNTFDLYPYEVVVGTSEDMSGDLATYQETKAQCDAHDYKRTHNKSLLYERTGDIGIKTSAYERTNAKFFDGVLDDLAWEDGSNPANKDKFVELDISKIQPTISKIVLSGWHLEDTVIKAGKAGELTEVDVAENTGTEFSQTYILKAPITPDVLRFEFHQMHTEVYEIEVF